MKTKALPRRWRHLILTALVLLGARQCFTAAWGQSRQSRSLILRAAEASTTVSEEEKQRLKGEFKEAVVAKIGDLPLKLSDLAPPDYKTRFQPALGGFVVNLLELKDLVEIVPEGAKVRYAIKVGDEANKQKLVEAAKAASEDEPRLKAEFREVILAKVGDLPLKLDAFAPPDYKTRFGPTLGSLVKNLQENKDLVELFPEGTRNRYVIKAGDEVAKTKLTEEKAARVAADAAQKQKAAEALKAAGAEKAKEDKKAEKAAEEKKAADPQLPWLRQMKGMWNQYLQATPVEKRDVNEVIAKLKELAESMKEPTSKTKAKKAAKKEASSEA